jgi:ubiquinone/menaquinone biosynthesis C-methylase UbiE
MNWKAEVKDRFSQKQEAARWDRMYEEETKNLADEHFRVRRNFTVNYILGRFDKAASVCDLGCGAGPVTVDLITHGYRVVGVDYSFDMLENARRRINDHGINEISLINSNGEHLPFRNNQFDLIVCLGVISYIENYEDVFQEIYRILRPGGTVIISYRNFYNTVWNDPFVAAKFFIKSTLVAFKIRAPEGFKIGRHMRAREVTDVAKDKGFVIKGFKGMGFGPFGLFGKKYFSEEKSISISGKLDSLFTKLHLVLPFRAAADVHVLVFEKSDKPC